MDTNINIDDVYYDKYIKYKTKYLELKEQSCNGLFWNTNEDLYGSNYYELDQCIIKTEVIKKIINVKGIPYIKNIIKHLNKERGLESNFNGEEDYIVDELTRNIIKNSKIETMDKESNRHLKNLRVKDIDNVLNQINKVLLNFILPDLYYKFEEKLQGKIKLTIKIGLNHHKFNYTPEELDNKIIEKLRKEIETQIKVKVKDENIKNIDNIVEIYKIFGEIITKYNNEYIKKYIEKDEKKELVENTFIQKKKELVENTFIPKKKELLEILKKIEPKVPLLIKVVELYFYFLEFYIINNIKRSMDSIYSDENHFQSILNKKINDKETLFLYKVYEDSYYGNKKLIENFDKEIKKTILSDTNIEYFTSNLIEILNQIRTKIISIEKENLFTIIINNINSNINTELNRDNININYNPTKWYKYYESTRWLEYYKNNEYLFKIDYIPLLLKKSINIYLYQMFIYKKNKYLKQYKTETTEIKPKTEIELKEEKEEQRRRKKEKINEEQQKQKDNTNTKSPEPPPRNKENISKNLLLQKEEEQEKQVIIINKVPQPPPRKEK